MVRAEQISDGVLINFDELHAKTVLWLRDVVLPGNTFLVFDDLKYLIY